VCEELFRLLDVGDMEDEDGFFSVLHNGPSGIIDIDPPLAQPFRHLSQHAGFINQSKNENRLRVRKVFQYR
jgi:hypothetical protein